MARERHDRCGNCPLPGDFEGVVTAQNCARGELNQSDTVAPLTCRGQRHFMSFPPASHPTFAAPPALTCRLCGYDHQPVPLAPGQHARCVRCATLLARQTHFGPDAPLAFALTGLILAVPALTLPFITVAKFGNVRVTLASSGAGALWQGGMPFLAVWIFICGVLGPVLLFAALTLLIAARVSPGHRTHRRLASAAHALEHWAMPEVHVLAVLVALIKLGTLANVFIGPGFWCYTAMAVVLLLAWRSFEYEPSLPFHVDAPARLPR
jgi:paraquat-inducible protein A